MTGPSSSSSGALAEPAKGQLTTDDASDIAPDGSPAGANPGRALGIGSRLAWWLLAFAVLIVIALASLAIGSRSIPIDTVFRALTEGRDGSTDVAVVLDGRLPRTAIGLLAGIGLGVAGAIIQAVTRNPLADPGILGVTFGSAFAVALAVGIFGLTSPISYVWFAFGGALVATVVVYLIGATGSGSASPAQLTLAGMALGAVLSGIISAMVLSDPAGFQAMRAWEAGSIANRPWETLAPVWPFIIGGVIVALLITPSLNAVALGDDLAAALGADVNRTRAFALIAVTLLAGGATAIAGPIAFVGLMIPHMARWIVGPDQRWIVGFSIVLAPSLLLLADIIGRVIMRPGELQVGIVTAFIGAPVLIALVRRQKATGL